MSRLSSRYRRHELDQEHANLVAKALSENPGRHLDEAKNGHRSALPGDPWRMRGVPIVGRAGVGGAIPGSRPDQAVK
jgi:hypothetical protein